MGRALYSCGLGGAGVEEEGRAQGRDNVSRGRYVQPCPSLLVEEEGRAAKVTGGGEQEDEWRAAKLASRGEKEDQ